jgi:hypothetical protein
MHQFNRGRDERADIDEIVGMLTGNLEKSEG